MSPNDQKAIITRLKWPSGSPNAVIAKGRSTCDYCLLGSLFREVRVFKVGSVAGGPDANPRTKRQIFKWTPFCFEGSLREGKLGGFPLFFRKGPDFVAHSFREYVLSEGQQRRKGQIGKIPKTGKVPKRTEEDKYRGPRTTHHPQKRPSSSGGIFGGVVCELSEPKKKAAKYAPPPVSHSRCCSSILWGWCVDFAVRKYPLRRNDYQNNSVNIFSCNCPWDSYRIFL